MYVITSYVRATIGLLLLLLFLGGCGSDRSATADGNADAATQAAEKLLTGDGGAEQAGASTQADQTTDSSQLAGGTTLGTDLGTAVQQAPEESQQQLTQTISDSVGGVGQAAGDVYQMFQDPTKYTSAQAQTAETNFDQAFSGFAPLIALLTQLHFTKQAREVRRFQQMRPVYGYRFAGPRYRHYYTRSSAQLLYEVWKNKARYDGLAFWIFKTPFEDCNVEVMICVDTPNNSELVAKSCDNKPKRASLGYICPAKKTGEAPLSLERFQYNVATTVYKAGDYIVNRSARRRANLVKYKWTSQGSLGFSPVP